jgi:hypothetical protein
MSNIRRLLVAIPILVFILACQLVSKPVQEVKDAAGTAAAVATQAGEIVTQASGLGTEVASFETLIPNLTDIPGGDVFDPKSPPLAEWNGIPILPQAIAGDETEGLYVYKVAVTSKEVEDFYAAQLPSLGWTNDFSMPGMEGVAILMYSKGDQTLSITVTTLEGYVLVMITLA